MCSEMGTQLFVDMIHCYHLLYNLKRKDFEAGMRMFCKSEKLYFDGLGVDFLFFP